MNQAVALRLATSADASAIAALFSASRGLLSFLPQLHSADEDAAFIRDVVLVACRVALAVRGDALFGFIAEAPDWIEHLYIAPEARGQGIGSALLADAKARQQSLTLWCFRDNHPARGFYARHGFVAVESTDGAGNEARLPDIRYAWSR